MPVNSSTENSNGDLAPPQTNVFARLKKNFIGRDCESEKLFRWFKIDNPLVYAATLYANNPDLWSLIQRF
jgi:hypothetical protein